MGAQFTLNLRPPARRDLRGVHDALDEFLSAHLVALQNGHDRAGQMVPLLFVLGRGFFARGSQRVVLALPAVVRGTPYRLDLPLSFELMEGGVQSALFELKCFGTAP